MENKFLVKIIILVLSIFLFSKPCFSGTTDILKSVEISIDKGDFISAEKDTKKVLETDTENPWARRLLARVYRLKYETKNDKKYLDSAKVEIEKALKTYPSDFGVNLDAMVIYYDLKDKANASKAIDMILKKDPSQAEYCKSFKAKMEALK